MTNEPHPVRVVFGLWLVLCVGAAQSADLVFKNQDKKQAFDQFALNEVLKAVYPLDKSDLRYVVDGTVDKQILTNNDLGSYGCLKPETQPAFMKMVRKYSNCELAVLQANPSPERTGCYERAGNKCELTLSAKVAYTQQATSGWKVGAKIKVGDLEVSTEYGESRTSSQQYEEQVQRKVTLNPGQTAIPYVIVAGIHCMAEIHGVDADLIGKLKGAGSKYEKEEISCPNCVLSCRDFMDGSLNNDFSRYKVPRECLYYKPTKTLYPVTSDPVVSCRKDKEPFFRGNMTMPLYDSKGNIVKVHIVYVTNPEDII